MLNENALLNELDNNIFVDNGSNNIGSNFITVTLSDTLKVYKKDTLSITNSNDTIELKIPEEGILLNPGVLYLGATNEYTKTYNCVPLLSGIDELSLLGVEIHITAGFGDNGFEGTWTLEITVTNPTILYKDMPIGKLYYYSLIGDNSITYNGKYIGQVKTTETRFEREYN